MELIQVLKLIAFYFLLCFLWLNILASLAIRFDHSLEKGQKIGQLVFVWLIPFIGAGLVLKLVYDHQPETIPRAWIPVFGLQEDLKI